MALVWRAVVVIGIFVVCGLVVAKMVFTHGVAGGAPVAQIRLSAAMAGLFAGGAAATVTSLFVAFARRRR